MFRSLEEKRALLQAAKLGDTCALIEVLAYLLNSLQWPLVRQLLDAQTSRLALLIIMHKELHVRPHGVSEHIEDLLPMLPVYDAHLVLVCFLYV